MIGFVRDTKEVAFFAPGQTKEGVAIFPRYDPSTTGVTLLIEGLSNDLDFRRDLRKALVLEFVRPGNVFYPGQTKLAFRRRIGGKLIEPKPGYLPSRDDDAHHGYDWIWLWNWETAARADDPKTTELPTPTGLDKQKFWHYKITLPNRTEEAQPLTVVRVETIVRVEVMGKVVDVPFVDDGRLDVYKTGFFEKEGLPVTPRRFPERIVKKVGADGKVDPADDNRIKPGEDASFLVAFRESDYDFDAVCTALVHALQTEMLTERNKDGGKKDMNKFFPNMKFGAAEMEKAKAELSGKVAAALSEQLKTRVLARVTLKSGLASGTHLIDFSLYKPAYVPPAAKQP
jgi:hypothetical protein